MAVKKNYGYPRLLHLHEISKHLLAGTYQKGETILVDADTVGPVFGRRRVGNGKEVVTKKVEAV